jgi:DNA-directed RNA polymerase beta' subunit|tara:strand:+ start:1901 stop:2167 length:267 start_codon:yes stop_codon:yes gene_type:complete
MKETVIIPESNKIGDKVIDRIYQNLHKTLELVNKDGTTYTGKIIKRTIKCEGYTSHVHTTADGRWFNRAGMPIDKPKNLIIRKEQEDG